MKLSTALLFASAALATAGELDNLGPEWEPVDIADGAEVADAHHRKLGGEYKLLSCRKKCDGSKKGREIKVCEYLVNGKYEVKKWEYWSNRSVCWGGTDRDPWSSSSSSSSSSSDSCRKEKKECKRKCDRRLLEETEDAPKERALGSKSSKSSKNKGGHKMSAKSSKSSKSETKKSDKGGKERRGDRGGDTGNDKGTGPDMRHRDLGTETSQSSSKSSKSNSDKSSKSSKSSSKSSKSSTSSRTRSANHGGKTGDDNGGGTGPDMRHRDLGSSKCKKECKREFRKCKREH